MAIRAHKRQTPNPTLKTQKCKRKAQDTTFIFPFGRFLESPGEGGGGDGGLPQLTLHRL